MDHVVFMKKAYSKKQALPTTKGGKFQKNVIPNTKGGIFINSTLLLLLLLGILLLPIAY